MVSWGWCVDGYEQKNSAGQKIKKGTENLAGLWRSESGTGVGIVGWMVLVQAVISRQSCHETKLEHWMWGQRQEKAGQEEVTSEESHIGWKPKNVNQLPLRLIDSQEVAQNG